MPCKTPRRWLLAGTFCSIGWWLVPTPSVQAQDALDPTTSAAEVHLVLEIRPRIVLQNAEWRRYLEHFTNARQHGMLGATLSGKIDQVLIFGTIADPPPRAGNFNPLAMVIRAAEPYDWSRYPTWKTESVAAAGFTYKRGEPDWFFGGCSRILDDRTLLVGTESQILQPPIQANQPPGKHAWDSAWNRFPSGSFRLALDSRWLTSFLGERTTAPAAHLLAPLLERTQAFACSMSGKEGLTIDAVAVAHDRFDAPRVQATVEAMRTLALNLLPQLRTPAERETPATTQDRATLTDKLDPVLSAVTIDQDGSASRVHLQADEKFLANAVDFLVPALPNGIENENWFESIRKMKEIGQAIFRYENQTGRKLNAVMYGRDGKTPHSWRVFLLPYLAPGWGNMVLYTEYDFDEPWNSPNNSRIIARMPRIFEEPTLGLSPEASIPAYYLVTGPATMNPLRPAAEQPPVSLKGGYHPVDRKIADPQDQTIQLVEAKRDIPWTKPEEIAYEVDGPIPPFGGYFAGGWHTLFADGHVAWIKGTIPPQILRALLTASGGEIIREGDY